MKLNIKKALTVALALCMGAGAPLMAQQADGAQNTENTRQPVKKNADNRGQQKAEEVKQRNAERGNTTQDRPSNQGNQGNQANQANQGNAFGRNKDTLSGREFGQNRAAEARTNNESRTRELDEAIVEGEKKVKEANAKIKQSREKLEKDRKDKKINDKQYAERKNKIEQAERKAQMLEEKVAQGKRME
jgi:colicin import membrane protein